MCIFYIRVLACSVLKDLGFRKQLHTCFKLRTSHAAMAHTTIQFKLEIRSLLFFLTSKSVQSCRALWLEHDARILHGSAGNE
jgi:hypothetical protein